MLMSHKIALQPNNKQATYFAKASGVARFAYNWALANWKEQYEAWQSDTSLKKPSQFLLRRQLNAIKREAFPWMLEVTKNAPQMAIIQLGQAFNNFFAKRAGYPNFRCKGKDDRFSLSNDQFKIEGSRIRIPHIGWVRMRESLRFSGKVMSAVIRKTGTRWFASITVELSDAFNQLKATQTKSQGIVGVDLGVSNLATLSTGEAPIAGPKAYHRLLKKLKRLSRSLSRKQKGSSNRYKAKATLAKLHARIRAIRHDALHKLSHSLTSRFESIVIEDLDVKGMQKHKGLSRYISDMGFYEFRRQLTYKADIRGNNLIIADRWYPSSKLCSHCDYVNADLTLQQRQWVCPNCHHTQDRDLNAAKNLARLAVSSTVTACGKEGAGLMTNANCVSHQVKPSLLKQEVNTK